MVLPDLRDDRSLAADDLGMKFGVNRQGDLEAPQGLGGKQAGRFSEISNTQICSHVSRSLVDAVK